jgi:hypothetical protein
MAASNHTRKVYTAINYAEKRQFVYCRHAVNPLDIVIFHVNYIEILSRLSFSCTIFFYGIRVDVLNLNPVSFIYLTY